MPVEMVLLENFCFYVLKKEKFETNRQKWISNYNV